jgi:unsaturated rhamnogalacturonyl hydrolase
MNEMIEEYINYLITASTSQKFIWNIEKIKNGKPMNWNYVDGCMFTSLLELYKVSGNPRYLHFVKTCIDSFLDEKGNIATYEPVNYCLDDICESRVLFTLFDLFKDVKYLRAINNTYEQVKKQPRTEEGNFWHKLIYPHQIWLDGLYMVMPFYIEYLNMKEESDYADIFNQYQNVYQIMFDKEKNLYYHGYDSSKSIFWADKKTGLSRSFWLRSIGWYLVSMVDVLEYSQNEAFNDFLKIRIRELVDGLLKYQDPESKMFCQVVDKPDGKGNYLETSGSAMIAYAISKSVRLQVLDHSYLEKGKEILSGICNRYLIKKDGEFHLGGICLSAGLGPENNPRRDGSYEYYLSEPVVANDAKGVAPIVMAYVEIKRGSL